MTHIHLQTHTSLNLTKRLRRLRQSDPTLKVLDLTGYSVSLLLRHGPATVSLALDAQESRS